MEGYARNTIGQVPFSAAIAILYPVFFHRLVNHATDYYKVRDMCKVPVRNGGFHQGDDEKECREKRDELLRTVEHKKHYLLVAAGLAGLFGSLVIFSPGAAQVGIGWGGVITLVVAAVAHWHIYNETQKLLISGGSLAAITFFSSRFL